MVHALDYFYWSTLFFFFSVFFFSGESYFWPGQGIGIETQ